MHISAILHSEKRFVPIPSLLPSISTPILASIVGSISNVAHELNALLNIDRDRSSSQDAPEETEETETPATRPSVLAALGEKTHQPEPVKPFRSYYDKDGDAR